MSARTRAARGQALVEMALGTLVFVTIFILGIHFAEVGFISLKATEAAASANWDETSMRATSWTNAGAVFYDPASMNKGMSGTAEQIAQSAYRDFDGRQSTNGATSMTQVFTKASQVQVSCRDAALAVMPGSYDTGKAKISTVITYATTPLGGKVDAYSCTASSQLLGFNIPKYFFEKSGSGMFKAQNYKNSGIGVCAFGRPAGVGGPCNGRMTLAIGDFGFAGRSGTEWTDCGWNDGCPNTAYYNVVDQLYEAQQNSFDTSSSILAGWVTGAGPPTTEPPFFMNSQGEDCTDCTSPQVKPFSNKVVDLGAPAGYDWPTTPYEGGYIGAYNSRGECFLGEACGSTRF